MPAAPRTVWRLSDGKRGHERQSDALVRALAERFSLTWHALDVADGWRCALSILGGNHRGAAALPAPDLIVGAGSACHLPLLAARRRYGGRALCLMRPQLPYRCYDACIVAAHDAPPARANVIVTEGPLNPMRPGPQKDPHAGLVLVGGPSRHHAWDNAAMVQQIRQIQQQAPALQWVVTDSRRTPATFATALAAAGLPNIRYQAFASAPADWLEDALARATRVWVSSDSVAMIYDALSAGAEVGVLDVPVQRRDRVSNIAAELRRRGWVASLEQPAAGNNPGLNEASRVADALLQRWPELVHGAA